MKTNNEVQEAIYRGRRLTVRDWSTAQYHTVLRLEHDRGSYWNVLYMDSANKIGEIPAHRKYISIDTNAEFEESVEAEARLKELEAAQEAKKALRKQTRSIEDDWQPS